MFFLMVFRGIHMFVFFFQAEDGIRDYKVTGVQTCALPILSLRLVPDQKLKAVERQLSAAVRRLAPKHVQASVKFLHGADPATVKVTHPAFKLLDQAFREVVGRGTVPARAGGSVSVGTAVGKGGAPVILTGIGLPDDRLHAPNEKLDLKQLWGGIRVFGRFYELLASLYGKGSRGP